MLRNDWPYFSSETMVSLYRAPSLLTHHGEHSENTPNGVDLSAYFACTPQVGLIGPATVGGIKPGCMRIGNTGGMLDNIVMSKV